MTDASQFPRLIRLHQNRTNRFPLSKTIRWNKRFRIYRSCYHQILYRCMFHCKICCLSYRHTTHYCRIESQDMKFHTCHSYWSQISVLTHLPLQDVSPARHAHIPLRQEYPGRQMFPHEPQADSSLFRSAQCVPLQRVIPFGQDAV